MISFNTEIVSRIETDSLVIFYWVGEIYILHNFQQTAIKVNSFLANKIHIINFGTLWNSCSEEIEERVLCSN